MKKAAGILLFILLNTTLLFADARLTATASKTNVGVGEQFEVDYTINASGDHFIQPDFNGFQILSGPNISTNMVSVNGNSSFTITYSYILAATREGNFTINAAAIVVSGHTLLSNSLKIRVKGQAPPQQSPQAQQSQSQAAPDADDNNYDVKDMSKRLFIRAEVDKSHAYVGEQIKVSYKVYVRVSVLGGQVDKAPDLNGFWNQDIVNKNPNTNWTSETVNGLKYSVATVKQSVIFAEHAGDLTIDPLAMTFMIRIPYKGTFDNPFGNYKDLKYSAKSEPLIVHAVPLPDAGKPANFTGAVGSFKVYADVDKKELNANETINYTFEISGSGNLMLINAPVINPPGDFDKYDPKSTDHITVDENGVSGTRQYSYLLIPRHQGDYDLSPIDFTYFNPGSKQYVTIRSQGFHIKVGKGAPQTNVPVFNSSDQQDVKVLDKDIRYIKTSSPNLYNSDEGLFGSGLYYALLLFGPVAFAGALYFRRWNAEQNSDVVKVKSRMANKIASKHLAQANTAMASGNKAAFYEAIAKGLYGYVSDKLNIPVADLNKENVAEKLKERSVGASTISQLTETMDLCEMARFAPVAGIAQQEILNKAKNIINEIEEKISVA